MLKSIDTERMVNGTPGVFSTAPMFCTFVRDMMSLLTLPSAATAAEAERLSSCEQWAVFEIPPLRLCSFLSHSYSPSLRRPPPDNAVTTCSIKQAQPGWQMCGSMTVVKGLVDVWQRQSNPFGYVVYVEGVVSLCQHCRLAARQM